MPTLISLFWIGYLLFLLGLFGYLLLRGVTHSFIAFFAAGALLELLQHLGFTALQQMPGGYSANSGYYPLLSMIGLVGALSFAIGFLMLANFLLNPKPVA